MLRVAAITLVLGGCVAPGAPVAGVGRLELGAQVAAPEGLLAYCARSGEACGPASISELRGRLAATGASRFERTSWSEGQSSLFHALMAERQSSPSSPVSPPSPGVERTRVEVRLSDARLIELQRVNRQINRAIRPTRDAALYGTEEYWARPLLVSRAGAARGDCEDYALEKRAALLGLGWPPEALALATAVSPRVGLHAVLVVSTDQGDIVLDNLYDRPRPIASLDYVWLSRQASAALGDWASVRLSATQLYASASGRPADAFHRMMRERAQGARIVEVAPMVAQTETTLEAAQEVLDLAQTAHVDVAAPVVPSKPQRSAVKPRGVGLSLRLVRARP